MEYAEECFLLESPSAASQHDEMRHAVFREACSSKVESLGWTLRKSKSDRVNSTVAPGCDVEGEPAKFQSFNSLESIIII